MYKPDIYLVDNGSLSPAATIQLRELAKRLSLLSSHTIQAVSLLHSHKVPKVEVDNIEATIVKRAMREAIKSGQNEFIIVPLFLGPSLAISQYLPQVIDSFRQDNPDLHVVIAAPLCGHNIDQPDIRLAKILQAHVQELTRSISAPKLEIALVDHGTPIKAVNVIRNKVADQLSILLRHEIIACSMERRDGNEYDFNDPLLENLAQISNFSGGQLIVAMFFLLEGRHAGPGGDVAEIAEDLVKRGVYTSIKMTALMGAHSLLLEILNDRLQEVMQSIGVKTNKTASN